MISKSNPSNYVLSFPHDQQTDGLPRSEYFPNSPESLIP